MFIVFPDIVKDSPKMRNLPKIFLRSFENVAPGFNVRCLVCSCISKFLVRLFKFLSCSLS